MLKGEVILNNQENEGNYKFVGVKQLMTRGFKKKFSYEAEAIAFTAIALILERYPQNADYFQTFVYVDKDGMETKFWCINDGNEIITFLLPSEY